MRFILLAFLAFIGLTMAEIGRSSYAGSLPLVLPEATTSGGNEEITGSNATGYKKDEKPESTSTTSSSSTSSSTTTTEKDTGLVQEIISELPVTLPPILQELDGPKRRVITYDQRQEGQYNIRADLDNFMFLLIPAAPVASDSFNILDIFGKSGSRRTAHSSLKTNKKKHYSPLKGEAFKTDASSIKYRQAMKNADYLPRSGDHQPSRVGEFIEGRTPYHVDISAMNEDEVQARLNPDRQVDVLPPPAYPLAYQHLMKPYLEADSSIIQTLPPAELQNRQNSESQQNAGYYRFARYIRGDNFLDTNRLGSQKPSGRRIQQIPIYRSDLSMGAAQLYPPLDVPHFNLPSTARSFEELPSTSSEEVESRQTLDGGDLTYEDVFLPSIHIRPLEDDLEFDLHTDGLIDGEAKALLSDGIERCAPGKRRDSYGVCREIEGY